MGNKFLEVFLEFIGYFKMWRVIPMDKRGVRVTLGKNPIPLNPGFHAIFPFEIDSVKTAIVKPEWTSTEALHITTTDGKTVTVAPTLHYRIIDIIAWLYENNDSASNLQNIIRFCTSDILTDYTWEECMKKPVWTKIKNKIKERTKCLGVEVDDFGMIDLTLSRVIITQI